MNAQLLAIAALATNAAAGPLDPPAGPVAPTNKTLQQVEPRIPISQNTTPGSFNSTYRITQPGSYYLTGNIIGESGKHGILINTSFNITIDLMGYELAGAQDSRDGISNDGFTSRNVRIVNGTVRNWGESGIDLFGNAHHIRDLHASGNAIDGIDCGIASVVESCTATNNGSAGFRTGSGSTVTNCTATTNDDGFVLGDSSQITSCAAYNNDADGICASSRSTVLGCTTNANTGDGIQADFDCFILHNSCIDNNVGVRARSSRNRIESNQLVSNTFGASLDGDNNVLIRCTILNNSSNLQIVGGSHKIGNGVSALGEASVNAFANITD